MDSTLKPKTRACFLSFPVRPGNIFGKFLTVLLLVSACLPAQITPTVVGGGYAQPLPIGAAPGQVITLFVYGLKNPPRQAAATGLPLPTSLSGISVTLKYTLSGRSIPVPLFRIEATNEPSIAAITVQIPFELKVPPMRDPFPPDPDGPPILEVTQDGITGNQVRVTPVLDRIHVLNLCDIEPRSVCIFDLVTHGGGQLVTFGNPAKSGETVVIYALGLGNTNTGVKTGEATPPNASLSDLAGQFRVAFEFLGARPTLVPALKKPEFVGLTQGFVGLYQVNVKIPELPAETPDCNTQFPKANLAVGIGGLESAHRAQVCVQR